MPINSTSFTNTPQATDDGYAWHEDQLNGQAIMVLDVLSNDLGGNAKSLYSIDNGDALADLLARDPGLTTAWEPTADGNLVRINAGKIEFQLSPQNDLNRLAQGETYTDTFKYAVQLGNGAVSWATVTVQVQGLNDGPQAVDDAATAGENQAISIDVLANDTDVDQGHVFTLLSVEGPAGKGSATVVDGKVLFDPGTDFDHLAQGDSATVELTYWMQDEHGAQSSAKVLVTVTGANDAPVAVADSGSGHENEQVTVDVLANDTDVDDNHWLSVTAASAPAGQGSASIVDGKVVFDPGTDFDHLNVGQTANVDVAYTIEDEHGAQASSTIALTITGTNDPAAITGVPTSASVQEDTSLSVGGDLDVEDPDNPLTFQAVAAADLQKTYGTFSFDPATGQWGYTLDNASAAVQALNTGDVRYDTLTVTSIDGTATATLQVAILGLDDVLSFTLPPQPVVTNPPINGTNQADTLTGTAGNDLINGMNGADTLNGMGGDDIINGGNSGDTLIGGPGNDYLSGQNGPDDYVYTSASDATDVILGFSPGDDQIIFQGPITSGGASLALLPVDTSGDGIADSTLLRVDSNGAADGGTLIDMAVVKDVPNLTMSDITWIA